VTWNKLAAHNSALLLKMLIRTMTSPSSASHAGWPNVFNWKPRSLSANIQLIRERRVKFLRLTETCLDDRLVAALLAIPGTERPDLTQISFGLLSVPFFQAGTRKGVVGACRRCSLHEQA
jgi:hypothetical protein